jgi:hypothetical protein
VHAKAEEKNLDCVVTFFLFRTLFFIPPTN